MWISKEHKYKENFHVQRSECRGWVEPATRTPTITTAPAPAPAPTATRRW